MGFELCGADNEESGRKTKSATHIFLTEKIKGRAFILFQDTEGGRQNEKDGRGPSGYGVGMCMANYERCSISHQSIHEIFSRAYCRAFL